MPSASGDDNGVDNDLVVSLLPTRNYTKIWRRTYYIGILISLKKSTTSSGSSESPRPSPLSSSALHTPLPSSEPPAPATARTSSSESHVMDILASDAEEEKEEDIEPFSRTMEKDLKRLLEHGGVDRVCSRLVNKANTQSQRWALLIMGTTKCWSPRYQFMEQASLAFS